MSSAKPQKRAVKYSVEKFLPGHCPKCGHIFSQQNSDWAIFLGDIVRGKKVVRETKGYDIIVCKHCGNYTARFKLESYVVFSLEVANNFLRDGFVNLCKVVQISEDVIPDYHVVSAKAPDISVEGIKAGRVKRRK